MGPQHGRRGRELARELGKVVGRQILVGHVVVAILAFDNPSGNLLGENIA